MNIVSSRRYRLGGSRVKDSGRNGGISTGAMVLVASESADER
jgi:hypothetical protein